MMRKIVVLAAVLILGLLVAPPLAAQAGPIPAAELPAGLARAVQAALAADGVIVPQSSAGVQEARLTASDAAAFDTFGVAVALDGDTALIGAKWSDPGGLTNAGAAYVFTRSGGVWSQQAKLTASDAAANDEFGVVVDVDGDTALIGAYKADPGGQNSAGAAYVFTRSGTTWSQQAKLTASDGAAYDYFGHSVALSGDTALVGAIQATAGAQADAGAAYVFTRSGTAWSEQTKLTASDAATGDNFGRSAALDGDTALVGALQADVSAQGDAGAAYVFTRSGTTWSEQAKLTASDAAAGDELGWSVALDGDTALVGAIFADVNGKGYAGAAYVFTRSGTTWSEQAILTAADAAVGDSFSIALDVEGDTALIGAAEADGGAQSEMGVVYVFTRSGTAWSQQAEFAASDTAAVDEFGVAVAIEGDTALVGALGAEVGSQSDAGAAYALLLLPERLTNGSLEDDADADKVPDGWTIKTPSGKSKQMCDNPALGKYYAYLGSCAVRLRSAGGKEKLQQTYTPSVTGVAGNAFTLSLRASGSGIPAGAAAKAVVKLTYVGGATEKFTLNLPGGSYDYQQFTLNAAAAQDYTSVKVTIQYSAPSGKLYVDDVSLAQTAP